MFKIGTKVRVTANPVDNEGAPGTVDNGSVNIVADNGATVAPIDGLTAIVVLNQVGTTTISAQSTVDGVDIPSDALPWDAANPASRVLLSAMVDEALPPQG